MDSTATSQTNLSYEELRMQKLRRNQQVLFSLGFDSNSGDQSDYNIDAKTPKSLSKKRILAEKTPALSEAQGPRRRSPRLSGEAVTNSSINENDDEVIVSEEEKNIPELPFDPSKVLQYSCYDEETMKSSDSNASSNAKSLQPIGTGCTDPSIKRIYSMSFHEKKPLLAVGGHQGRCSIFSSTFSNDDEIIFSFKPTRGWISRVRFMNEDVMEAGLLITANDGSMSLWDCTVQRDEIPKCSFFEQNLHGGSGIYNFDMFKSKVITCSKDGSLCYLKISDRSGAEVLRRFENAHEGVVKSVAVQPNQEGEIFASTGNDAYIRIWDNRVQTKLKPVIELESSFGLAVNSIKWNFNQEHMLLASSFAPIM
jgi:WD40 repeat protein